MHRRMVRKLVGTVFHILFLVSVMIGIVGLLVLLIEVSIEGLPWLSTGLLLSLIHI